MGAVIVIHVKHGTVLLFIATLVRCRVGVERICRAARGGGFPMLWNPELMVVQRWLMMAARDRVQCPQNLQPNCRLWCTRKTTLSLISSCQGRRGERKRERDRSSRKAQSGGLPPSERGRARKRERERVVGIPIAEMRNDFYLSSVINNSAFS